MTQTKLDECVVISYNDRQKFYSWCKDNKIHVQYEGNLDPWAPAQPAAPQEAWYVPNEAHRAWAKLRWS